MPKKTPTLDCTAINMLYIVANPKWQNIVHFSNLKIEPPYAALKLALWLLFQRITAHLIQLVSFCGPVVHTDPKW